MKSIGMFASVFFLSWGTLIAQTPDGESILKRVDAAQTFSTMKAVGTMTITDSLGARKTTFINYTKGKDDTFMEFTSAAEKGQKILRNAKELYLFFPDAEEVTRLQGAALRQSMAGSDISYEDMTGTRNRSDNYTTGVEGSEIIDGRDCWKLLLTAKTRNVAYSKQELWVDKVNYLPVKGLYYALSGKVLKELSFGDVEKMGAFAMSTRIQITDKLKAGSKTELRFSSIEIDKPMDLKIFTLENLSW